MDLSTGWDVFFCSLSGRNASVLLNLDVAKEMPVKQYPYLVYVFVMLKDPDSAGMTRNDENQVLLELEKKLLNSLGSIYGACYIGRVTADGKRDFYFYCRKGGPKIEEVLQDIMSAYSDYQYTCGQVMDEDWGFYYHNLYTNLLPQEENIQGNVATIPREIDHILRFPTVESRYLFIYQAKRLGFIVRSQRFFASNDEFPYELMISHIDYGYYEAVDEVARKLSGIARKLRGVYIRWNIIEPQLK